MKKEVVIKNTDKNFSDFSFLLMPNCHCVINTTRKDLNEYILSENGKIISSNDASLHMIKNKCLKDGTYKVTHKSPASITLTKEKYDFPNWKSVIPKDYISKMILFKTHSLAYNIAIAQKYVKGLLNYNYLDFLGSETYILHVSKNETVRSSVMFKSEDGKRTVVLMPIFVNNEDLDRMLYEKTNKTSH